MIWFQCKSCGKTHSRPESSVGSLVFCECGQGNAVPWESTAPPPIEQQAAQPGVPILEPMRFEQPPVEPAPVRVGRAERGERRERRSRRPGRKFRFDPNFCLNHSQTASRKTCRDCGEAFCDDCVIEMAGDTLCGPCKNFRVRSWQQPPRVSGFALFSVLIALVAAFFAALMVRNASPTLCVLALFPQVLALALGAIGLLKVERNPALGGRSLAITGMLMASTAIFLIVLFSFFTPGLLRA